MDVTPLSASPSLFIKAACHRNARFRDRTVLAKTIGEPRGGANKEAGRRRKRNRSVIDRIGGSPERGKRDRSPEPSPVPLSNNRTRPRFPRPKLKRYVPLFSLSPLFSCPPFSPPQSADRLNLAAKSRWVSIAQYARGRSSAGSRCSVSSSMPRYRSKPVRGIDPASSGRKWTTSTSSASHRRTYRRPCRAGGGRRRSRRRGGWA